MSKYKIIKIKDLLEVPEYDIDEIMSEILE